MRFGEIPAHWYALHPAGRIDARYWLTVHDLLVLRGVLPEFATDEVVRAAMQAATVMLELDRKQPTGENDELA